MNPMRPWSVRAPRCSVYLLYFTRSIVQILTPEQLVEDKKESDAALERVRAQVLSLLALLVRQYKY
jgi:hypothetical protein